MRNKTFLYKIMGGYFVMIAAVITIFTLIPYQAAKGFFYHVQTQRIAEIKEIMLESAPEILSERGKADILPGLTRSLNGVSVRLFTADEMIVFLMRSGENDALADFQINRLFTRGEISIPEEGRDWIKQKAFIYAVPVREQGRIIGGIAIAVPTDIYIAALGNLKNKLLFAALFFLILFNTGAFFYARMLSRPVGDLLEAAGRIAEGDFNVRILPDYYGEMKSLTDSFNDMAAEIQNLFNQLSREKDQLSAIVTSIQSGLAVLDEKGKILAANDYLKKLYPNITLENRFYWEIVKENVLNEFIETAFNQNGRISKEMTIRDHTFICTANTIEIHKRVVLILEDVTDIRKLEKVKRDFVANVSHELKTPMTSIKGFLENLIESETDEQKRYDLNIIDRNTDRLIRIVQDLLLLDNLEDRGTQLELSKIDLYEIIQQTVKTLEKKTSEKGISIQIEIRDDARFLTADQFKISQVFLNLLDNAVKFTEKGSITVRSEMEGQNIKIHISDTGSGIPKEHLSRLFERFYVVDQSRSRSLGGTGLGLSIVKHIVLAHGGNVTVESRYGEGSTFIVTLPTRNNAV